MVVRVAPRAPGSPASAPGFDREDLPARPQAPPLEPARRDRRLPFDSIAIGAPLTAAFVGALLADGGLASRGGASPSGEGDAASAVRQGAGAKSVLAGDKGQGAWSQIAAVDGALVGDAVAGEAVDPDAASGIRQFGETGGTGASAESLEGSSSELSAGIGAKAALTAGPSVSVTLMSLDDSLPGVDDGTEPGAGSSGPIGKYIEGSNAGDVIHGTEYDDYIRGGAGDDVIYGHAGDDVLDGGPGNDRLYGGPGNDRLIGGEGHDHLYGGAGDDVLLGGPGNDLLFGGTGRDVLDGGPGNDRLDGGPGADRMFGGSGDDLLIVDNIHDVAIGGGPGVAAPGINTLVVNDAYAAHLHKEFGENSAVFVSSENFGQSLPAGLSGYQQQVAGDIQNITLEGSADHSVVGGPGANVIQGNDGDNVLYGRGGDDILRGGGGNDLLDGGAGADKLYGGPGDDILRGGRGADELYGGAGNDILDGGPGPDRLYGGAGNDTYLLGLHDKSVDWIHDQQGLNQMQIQQANGHLVETAVAGSDLYVVVDKSPVAIVDGFRGYEDAWAGIDSGAGVVPIDQLMAANAGNGPALASATTNVAPPQADLLAEYLPKPSLVGSAGADVLSGTSGADWLVGNAGNDHLIGGAGNDILQGGPGNNLLEGGSGDDIYLFKVGQTGFDSIRDVEGANHARLEGFEGAKLQAVLVGRDLMVVADNRPLFQVENYVGNEDAFAGIERGDSFVPTQDLFA